MSEPSGAAVKAKPPTAAEFMAEGVQLLRLAAVAPRRRAAVFVRLAEGYFDAARTAACLSQTETARQLALSMKSSAAGMTDLFTSAFGDGSPGVDGT